jgi:hypothetical protein
MIKPDSNAFALTVAVNSISPGLRTMTPPFSAKAPVEESRKRRIAWMAIIRREECILWFNG